MSQCAGPDFLIVAGQCSAPQTCSDGGTDVREKTVRYVRSERIWVLAINGAPPTPL